MGSCRGGEGTSGACVVPGGRGVWRRVPVLSLLTTADPPGISGPSQMKPLVQLFTILMKDITILRDHEAIFKKTGVTGLLVLPHRKKYVGVLTPSTSGRDLFWRLGLCTVKMEPLTWALIQWEWRPYERD